jgi:transcriptional regulator with XRE-family HTH domain
MKNKTTWLQKRASAKIGQPGFETQRLLLRLTERFASRMEERKVRRADLARELGVDRSMVTRLLNGDQNVTIKTLVAMASALDCRLDFELQDLQNVQAGKSKREFDTNAA